MIGFVYSSDPGVSTCVEELFATMATTPACWEGLHSRFLPTAVHILQSPEAQLPAGILCVSRRVSTPGGSSCMCLCLPGC